MILALDISAETACELCREADAAGVELAEWCASILEQWVEVDEELAAERDAERLRALLGWVQHQHFPQPGADLAAEAA